MIPKLISYIKRSLKWKLIVLVSVLLIFIITCIGVLSYWSTSKTVKGEIDRVSQEIIKQANLNLERYFKSYTQGFLLISAAPEVKSWMRLKPDDKIASYLLFDDIVDTYFQPFIFHNSEVIAFSLYNSHGVEMSREVKYGRHIDYSLKQLIDEINFGDDPFYMDVRISKEYMINYESIELPVLTMVNKLKHGGYEGYIKIDIDLSPALEIINKISLGGTAKGIIVNQEGKIIAHPHSSLITTQLDKQLVEQMEGKQNGSFYLSETNEIVLFQTLSEPNWRTLIIIDFDEFSKSLIEIRYIILMIAIVSLIISLLLTVWIGSSITNRIRRLRQAIRRTELKKFQSFVKVEGSDEIAELGLAYNTMLTDLEQHVMQLEESKDLQRDAEFSALQSQIDAHFLYNTLESINSMANIAGEKDIEQTTIALAKMLRYTSNYRGMMVTLSDEYEHLKNYLHIIQTRFGEDFSYEWQVEEACLNAQCIKVLLQPIVENCIKHGMQKEQHIHVDISIKRIKRLDGEHEDIVIIIKDNGGGFNDEKLSELNEQLHQAWHSKSHLGSAHNRVGLINIYSRLRMYYSEDQYAGMSISNCAEGKGAVVTLRFPYAEITK